MVRLPRVQKEITACLQCGYCIDVCEAHNQTPWESVTPRGKIYYITQQGTCPPLFILFVNDEKLMHFAYERYLENYFRKTFDFTGTPIKFILREKKKEH